MAAILFAGGRYGIKSEVLEMRTGSEIPGEHRQGSRFLLRRRDWHTREKVRVRMKRSSGRAYQSIGASEQQDPLFSGEMPVKSVSKKELYRSRREERGHSFEIRQPFQCGLLMPKRKPLVYKLSDDGNWQENPGGRVILHKRLQKHLT